MIQTLVEMLQGMGADSALQGERLFFRRLPRGLSAFLSQSCTRTFSGCHTPFACPACSVVSSIIALASLRLSPQDRSPLEVDQSGIVLPASA